MLKAKGSATISAATVPMPGSAPAKVPQAQTMAMATSTSTLANWLMAARMFYVKAYREWN